MRRTALVLAIAGASTFVVSTASSQQPSTTTRSKAAVDHVMFEPSQLTWGQGPPSLPSGAKATVLEGDPNQEGPFTLRLQMPAGYRVMPHSHPADEHITVIEGTLFMGLGDQFNENTMKPLERGSFSMMKAGTTHYVMTKTGATVQLHGIGPWNINYVNPADDPREQRASR